MWLLFSDIIFSPMGSFLKCGVPNWTVSFKDGRNNVEERRILSSVSLCPGMQVPLASQNCILCLLIQRSSAWCSGETVGWSSPRQGGPTHLILTSQASIIIIIVLVWCPVSGTVIVQYIIFWVFSCFTAVWYLKSPDCFFAESLQWVLLAVLPVCLCAFLKMLLWNLSIILSSLMGFLSFLFVITLPSSN